MDNVAIVGLVCIVVLGVFAFASTQQGKKERYRDPLYLYPQKYVEDYYPRSRGNIYDCGDMFSGYNSYPKAY